MASIAQNVLMALTATVNKFASSNVQAVPRGEGWRHKSGAAPAYSRQPGAGTRRSLLLLLSVATADAPQATGSSQTDLLKRFLKKSEENRAKNDKERLESYYKRNYMDYFQFEEGSLRNKKDPLTESEKGILDWLQRNK